MHGSGGASPDDVLERPSGWPFALVALFVVATVIVLSSLTARQLPRLGPPGFDKVLHVGVWAVLAGCLTLAWWPSRGAVRAAAYAVAVALAFGIADELRQGLVAGRTSSLRDLAADLVGAGIGAGLAAWVVAGLLVYRRRDADGP